MTIQKKLTAGLMAAMMTFGAASTALAALPGDVQNSPYEEAIETLNALEIMVGDDDGQFRPDATIRRSEFAKVAVEAMGLGDVAKASNHKTKYPDVVENHWANGYINVATDQNVVIGDDQANFRPDDSISYAEAMTILVRILGHEPSALAKGGFPTGYINVGSQNGISKNAAASANDKVVRGMVAQMTFNSLTVKMMEQKGFGSDEKYEVVDKTLLEDVLNVTKGSGQITAVGISSISGTSALKDNEVRIGDSVYTVADRALADVRNLLGFNVTYYVKELSSSEDELILARAEKGKNHSVTVAAKNMDEITEEDGKNTTVAYWEDKDKDNKTKTLSLSKDAKMIYNGKMIEFDSSRMKPESGRVTFLDVDNDDVYDIVFVTSLSNIVVDSVLTGSHKVTDKYGNPSLVLDPDDKDVKFTLTKSGQVIELADLNEWDVLSVAKSLDGTVLSVEASGAKVSGKVTEVNGDKRTVNGEEYEIAKNYTDEIKLNDEGTFYLDVEGKIAAVDTSATLSSNYAYMVDADLTSDFDNLLQVKVFTKDGETKILKSANKIKFNGKSAQTPQSVLEELKNESGKIDARLVTYELNSKGELNQLNTAKNLTESGSIDKNHFALNAQGTLTYKSASKKLGSYNVNSNTLIFNIPAGETDTNEYAVETISYFDDNESYTVQVFDVKEDLTAQVVLVSSTASSASVEAPIAVVDQISDTTNSDNDRIQKLYVYQNGERVSFETDSDGILVNGDGAALKKGDIVQLKMNAKNQITGLRVLFEADKKGTEFTKDIGNDLSLVYGRVTKKFAGSMNVQVNEGAVANYSLDGVTVYELNTKKTTNAIKVVDANEITQYDDGDQSRVFVKIYKDAVKEVVIVK